MSGKHPIPDAALRCRSCGKLWTDHMGIQPTCAENIRLRSRVAELADRVDELEAELAKGARNER
jgi:hypothetical protein